MSHDVTDTTIARLLAVQRWGPTGFQCPRCGHDRAYHLAPRRPRQFQCRRCRRQRSVTADTAMHGSKLPLKVWMGRGEWHELGAVPTSRAFAAEHDIAPSSAWHLNQRFMAAVDLGQPPALRLGGYAVERLRCRRPRATPALSESAHPHLRQKRFAFLDPDARPPLVNEVVVGVGGRELVLVDMCADPETVIRLREEPMVIPAFVRHSGFEHWLRTHIERHFRTVCVRWMGRYLRCLLQLWARLLDPRTRPVQWTGAVLAGPRRHLGALRSAAAALA